MLQDLKLVPPSLTVLAIIWTSKIDLEGPVILLADGIYQGRSYSELETAGYAPIKIAHTRLPKDLAACMTVTRRASLLWVHEVRCHSYCGILGDECGAQIDCRTWLEKIYKKHESMLDSMPNA
jgi:hypothetical protein